MELIKSALRSAVIALLAIIAWIHDNAWDLVGPIVVFLLHWLLRRLPPIRFV